MRFSSWYPLVNAAAHAPIGESVLQLRVAAGLIDYPRGKSAMVRYVHANDARGAALALERVYRDAAPPVWCRHLEDTAGARVGEVFARVHGEFERRFGAPPRDEAEAAP